MNFKKKYLFTTILLPIQVFFVAFLSSKTAFVEIYYSRGIFPFISKFFRFILGWIPFSVGDVLLIILLFYFFRGCYKIIKSKGRNFLNYFLKFTAIISILYGCFYFFWGFNYFRAPLANALGLKKNTYTTKQLLSTTDKIVAQLNYYQKEITDNDSINVKIPYKTKLIYKKALNGFENISSQYPILTYQNASVKSSLVSLLQSYNGTSGYMNPLTNEAQVNRLIPSTSLPATTCHEMAHQIGWAAEEDANFIGFITSIKNEDLYFKYSGYRMAFAYLMRELYKRDKNLSDAYWKKVNFGVVLDFRNAAEQWKKYENPIEPYFKKGYNSYLKANKQAKGIKSYNYVVDLIIAYYQQNS